MFRPVQTFSVIYSYIEKRHVKTFTHWHLFLLMIFLNHLLINFFFNFSTIYIVSIAMSIRVSAGGKRVHKLGKSRRV